MFLIAKRVVKHRHRKKALSARASLRFTPMQKQQRKTMMQQRVVVHPAVHPVVHRVVNQRIKRVVQLQRPAVQQKVLRNGLKIKCHKSIH
jgi:hypothetical protein